jgi:MFS transporter, FHS family, glucose/mannose:H+ symporter
MYNKKLVFWAACFGMLLFGICLITLGSIAPDLKIKFQLNDISAGTLFSILPIGILGGSLLFGPVCDRYGYKLILILSCAGMCAGFEGIAFAASLSFLKASVFIFGFCAGIINGATNAVVSDISTQAKGANLSLLGVFFGIGALGMPFLLAVLKSYFSSFQILSGIGWLMLAVGIFYSLVKFPPSKKALGFAFAKTKNLFKEKYLILIALFLLFQGCMETIFNNWTTTYFTRHLLIAESNALYALSLFVVGMTVMRLLIGSVFRKIQPSALMFASLVIILSGILLIHFGQAFYLPVTGLILVGVGLAAGFPIMLGLAGNRYAAQSGVAFSFIFTIGLTGNMLVNYLMGIVADKFGIHHLTTFAFVELIFMLLFCLIIFRLQPQNYQPPITENAAHQLTGESINN